MNACHSEKLAQAFVRARVPHVIAVNAEDQILDVAARCFSRRLYQALFNQDSVADSFKQSRDAIKLDDGLKKHFNSVTFEQGVNFGEAFKFRLLPQVAHNQSLIIEPADSHQVIYPQWSNTNIPREDPNFIGRRQEIHQVIKVLVESDKRCISLHGMGGIGKTAVSYAIGRWLHERDRYKHGVWFISLRDTDSVGTLIIQVQKLLELRNVALERELRNRRVFLILDDLDKLIEKEADKLIDLLNSLLQQCPNIRLLLTSRDSLVRDIDYCHQEEVCSMGASETRQIFKKYAPPEAEWGNNDDLAEDFRLLVEFLDGYPLPIKLAASYMKATQAPLKKLRKRLDTKPLKVLDSDSYQARKEKSLRITLELSFELLSVEAKNIFTWLAFFPSGFSDDLAEAIEPNSGEEALEELLKFSMAEKSSTASDYRVTLPEPARTYAESKLQQGRGIEYLAPKVLDFYHDNFCGGVIKLFENKENNKGQQLLLQEKSNLILFLEWGYEYETSSDKICRCARMTASLSPYWRWIEANQDPLIRLNSALKAAQRNQDEVGEDLVRRAIADVSAKGAFKDVQSLAKENDDLNSFDFETVTVNRSGEIIKRESKQAQLFTETIPPSPSDRRGVGGEVITLEMVYIPGGTFIMGSPQEEGNNDEKPQHQVTVPPFFMGKTLITQEQWQAVANLPLVKRELKPDPSYFKGDNLPVEQVSWYDAVEFCARLSNHTGQEYRLPSEAEWEYACRAGTTTPFHFGETITNKLANYDADRTFADESEGQNRTQTITVGQSPPNAFGLYDMHGNVWEWCLDDWHDNYENAPTDGSAWFDNLDQKSLYSLLRGGSWNLNPDICRSASRHYDPLTRDDAYYFIGFRVVCAVGRAFY